MFNITLYLERIFCRICDQVLNETKYTGICDECLELQGD